MLTVSQFLVLCPIAIAAWVAAGLARKRVMWKWIVLYWAVLTAKNYCDWMNLRPNKPNDDKEGNANEL